MSADANVAALFAPSQRYPFVGWFFGAASLAANENVNAVAEEESPEHECS